MVIAKDTPEGCVIPYGLSYAMKDGRYHLAFRIPLPFRYRNYSWMRNEECWGNAHLYIVSFTKKKFHLEWSED